MTRFHGGGNEWPDYYDFSGTGNSLPPPRIIDKLLYEMIRRRWHTIRPEHSYTFYREKISELLAPFSVEPNEIVPVSGVSDALRLSFLIFKPKVVVVLEPCSGEHRELSRLFGAKYAPVTFNFEESICNMDLSKIESLSISYGDKKGLIVVSNPSNPAGCMYENRFFELLLDATPRNWLVFVNEVFGDYLDYSHSALSLHSERVVVARSFNKTLGLQGLRAGYIVAREKELVTKYDAVRDPWPISTLAAKLIEMLIEEEGLSGYRSFIERSKRSLETEKKYIYKMLTRASYRLYPSVAPYILIEHAWIKHSQIDLMLDKYRVRIRDASTYYGLSKNFSRIAVKTRSKNKVLTWALRQIAVESGIIVY
jgi:histidinol-phosphate/aromatic aminotransferase/cobyric acid decarboxylase-like protein